MWKVYKFTCKIYNDKAECYKGYVGITINTVEKRFQQHCKDNNCKVFHSAIKKYGKNNWTLEILEDNIKTEKEALEKETFYIDKHNTLVKFGKGYNIVRHAKGRVIVNGKLKCYGLWMNGRLLKHFLKIQIQNVVMAHGAKIVEKNIIHKI